MSALLNKILLLPPQRKIDDYKKYHTTIMVVGEKNVMKFQARKNM